MKQDSTAEDGYEAIEGHVIWSSFIRAHLITGGVTGISLLYTFFSLFVWRQGIHTIQLILFLVGISGMVYFFLSLFTVVTYFRFDGNRLTVRRFGRRQREVAPSDVVSVQNEKLGTVTSLWLRDGSTLQFCFKSLPQARSVVELLQRQMRNENRLEGHVNVLALAKVSAPFVVPSAIAVLVPTIFAVMGLLAKRQAIWNGGVLGWFLASMMFLPLVILCFAIYDRWGLVVAYYCWDGSSIRLRKLGSRRIREYLPSEIVSITSIQEHAPTIESGVGYLITMGKKDRYKLLTAFLPSGHSFGELLKRQLNHSDSTPVYGFRAVTIEQMEDMQRVKSLLQPDEELLWLARPQRSAVWSRVAAEIIFGLIPITLGGSLAAICIRELMRGGDGAWIGTIVGAGFVVVGLYAWTAPWRYQRLLSNTLYAVTNRRALILDGVMWDERGVLQRSESKCDVVNGAALELFEVLVKPKAISFGSLAQSGRKGVRLLRRGFFAPQDLPGAIRAVKWAIHQNAPNPEGLGFVKNNRV